MGRIVGGAYPCGLRLPAEAALAAELTCGRSTIREALRYLADLGLVRSRRGSGAMVLDFRREGTPALLPTYVMSGRLERVGEVAREMLHMRTMMACEAVRLAAKYAASGAVATARAKLAKAPALEQDPAAHAINELELYRELVLASGIYPVAWLVNAFWAPLRELNAMFAPAMGPVSEDFQETMERVLDLIEEGRADEAVTQVRAWFEVVDGDLCDVIERTIGDKTGAMS